MTQEHPRTTAPVAPFLAQTSPGLHSPPPPPRVPPLVPSHLDSYSSSAVVTTLPGPALCSPYVPEPRGRRGERTRGRASEQRPGEGRASRVEGPAAPRIGAASPGVSAQRKSCAGQLGDRPGTGQAGGGRILAADWCAPFDGWHLRKFGQSACICHLSRLQFSAPLMPRPDLSASLVGTFPSFHEPRN